MPPSLGVATEGEVEALGLGEAAGELVAGEDAAGEETAGELATGVVAAGGVGLGVVTAGAVADGAVVVVAGEEQPITINAETNRITSKRYSFFIFPSLSIFII